jgi:hypothetical protein
VKSSKVQQNVYAEDLLAGLCFFSESHHHWFRIDGAYTGMADKRFDFNHALDPKQSYALIDPETGHCVGIDNVSSGTTTLDPFSLQDFRLYLLRPLLRNL